ncbi:hypothetical protein [Microvirus mar17]|uniref:Uncharacterized protein n=1 Tax=Microvirus mar17 TaxID=2851149 RepID=A0A8F5RBZ1_9VIRU|nr:hypothetical protein [Microvirus mar17]
MRIQIVFNPTEYDFSDLQKFHFFSNAEAMDAIKILSRLNVIAVFNREDLAEDIRKNKEWEKEFEKDFKLSKLSDIDCF